MCSRVAASPQRACQTLNFTTILQCQRSLDSDIRQSVRLRRQANVRIGPLDGVAVIVERFYKPELDSLHNPRAASCSAKAFAGAIVPVPGAN
jgi:hypothetical protein